MPVVATFVEIQGPVRNRLLTLLTDDFLQDVKRASTEKFYLL